MQKIELLLDKFVKFSIVHTCKGENQEGTELAVSIRFRRGGRRNRPFYRIVVADARSPRDGKFIENLGYYDPLPDPEIVKVKEDRVVYWMVRGAIPTQSVKSIFRRQGIWKRIVEQVEQEKSTQKQQAQSPQLQAEAEVATEQGGNDD